MSNSTPPDKTVYRGRLITLGLETVELLNGRRVQLEIVRHPGGAVVVALSRARQVCLLHQHRHAAGGRIWELPAGTIDPGETPPQTAARELREEAGVAAAHWQDLGSILPSPGFCDEVLHLYLAQGIERVHTDHQHDELIDVHWVDFDEAVKMAHNGDIRDAKTLVGLFRAGRLLAG